MIQQSYYAAAAGVQGGGPPDGWLSPVWRGDARRSARCGPGIGDRHD